MKHLFYLSLFLVLGCIPLQSQSLTIVSPAGLTPPYEVAPGTEITFQWDYFFEAPTAIFTHTEAPVFPGFGTDPAWVEHHNSVDNGDGTYNITLTIDEPVWVWGGFFAPFISQWSYSEVLEIQVASDVVIAGDDLLLCNDGMDTELLSLTDTFTNYQWYLDGSPLTDETTASLTAATPGSYYVAATANGETVNSNTLHLSYIEIGMSGALSGGGTEIVLSTEAGMDSYQWLSGPDANNLSPIAGATDETYTATLTSDLTYYAAEAILAGCTVQSEARPVLDSYFAAPLITVAADTNSFNVVCQGTPVTYSVDDTYATYQWLKDGFNSFSTTNQITLSQAWEEGDYSVEVTNSAWPEIVITSATVTLNYQDIVQPQLLGITSNGQYCPGETLDVLLSDEGYDYTWYSHDGFNNYTEEDIIEVPGATHSFVFDTSVYITVVADFQGCTSSRSVFLNTYENASMFLNVEDFNQSFLCPDSSNTLFLPAFLEGDFQDFQWQQEIDGTYESIAGADTTFLEVTEPGSYRLEASVAACPSAVVSSSPQVIRDYTERQLFIWATAETLCVGEEATLNISSGFNWESIQWFEEDIVIGNMGYEETFIPMIGAGSEESQVVDEFQSYLVKAKHHSCPNGLKTTSNVIDIRPTVNPTITPSPDYGINSWHVAPYDSIPAYVFCVDEPVTLSLSGQYDSYSWHTTFYAGDDDYQLGLEIAGANTDTVDILATGVDWYTAVVDSAGCVGYSDPILIDTWIFQSPVVASYNNNEICPDEPALLNIGFPGDWVQVEWLLDGEIIPNSNNDSIYVTEPGTYVVQAYPALCPQFAYSSDVGPTLTKFEAEIVETDTTIVAIPFDGVSYHYEWFVDGEPVASDPDFPWIIHKMDLIDGAYTVKITNAGECTVSSSPYLWTDIEDINLQDIKVYPNPTDGQVFVEGFDPAAINEVKVFNLLGEKTQAFKPLNPGIVVDLSREKPGLYIIDILTESGRHYSWKINRM